MTAAIEASSVSVRTMVDGTLRLTIDIEPRNAIQAFTLFGAPGTALAVAALKPQAEQIKKPPKPVLQSQWLAMRCEDRDFQLWVDGHWGDKFTDIPSGSLGSITAEVVRRVLGIKSRAEIDSDHEAFERFERLIRKPWAEHNRQTA